MPTVRILQCRNEFPRRAFAELRLFGPLEAIRNDSVNSATIVAGIADKGIIEIFLWERVAAIDGRSSCSCKVTRSAAATFDWPADQSRNSPSRADHAPRFLGADAIDLRCRPVHRNARQAG